MVSTMVELEDESEEGLVREYEALESDFDIEEILHLEEILPDGIYEGLLDDHDVEDLREMLEEDWSSGAKGRRDYAEHVKLLEKSKSQLAYTSKFAGWSMVISSVLILLHLAWVTGIQTIADYVIGLYFFFAIPLALLGLVLMRKKGGTWFLSTVWAVITLCWTGFLVLIIYILEPDEVGSLAVGWGMKCFTWFILLVVIWTFIMLRMVKDDVGSTKKWRDWLDQNPPL
jgi:hypothetical protein